MVENLPVVVDGATGYIGSHLVHTLTKNNIPVRALVHPQSKACHRQFLESCQATVYQLELDGKSPTLLHALSGVGCVVHLIGSIAPRRGEKLASLHVDQTATLISACQTANVKKIVLISALGSSANALSTYHRTKWQAEECLRNSGLDYVILRPSLILGHLVGTRDSKLMARYRKIISQRSCVPLINGGCNKLQPVFIEDLVHAIKISATADLVSKQTLEIGGPDIVSMKELILQLMAVLDISKPLVAIPAYLATLAASVLEVTQQVPLVSRDQVQLSCLDNICTENRLESVFNVCPTSLSKSLTTYCKPNHQIV